MLNLERGIDSLTNFKRQTAEYLERLHKTGEPVVLTINGKAQVVVQDAAAYQKLLDAAAKAVRTLKPVVRSRRGGRSRLWPGNTASRRRTNSVTYRVRLTAKAEADV